MKKLLLIPILFFNVHVFSQCDFSFESSTTAIDCPGDPVILTAAGSETNLTSTFSAGNNHRGNMFDIVATNEVVIESFDAHPMGTTDIQIYYKTGTYAGFESNSNAWTLIGTAAGVVANAYGTPTPVPIDVNVTIPAGQTYAFYVTSSNTAISLNYTDGSSVGAVYSSDANISFLQGVGLEYPFTNGGGVFSPRVWNGIIHYTVPGNTSFSWSTGETTPSITVNPEATTNYSVDITNGGCPTENASVEITVPDMSVDLGTDLSFCEGFGENLDAQNSGATYSWNTGESSQIIAPDTSGLYVVEVTTVEGCILIDSNEVTVYDLPEISLGNDTLICESHTLILNAGNGYTNYEWSNAESTSTIMLNGSMLGVGLYSYSVEVTDNNGCLNSDTIEVTVDGCLSIDEVQSALLSVYPVPTNDEITIRLDELSGQLQINIYALDGKLVFSETRNEKLSSVNLSSLNVGNYILEVKTSNLVFTEKIIKQ